MKRIKKFTFPDVKECAAYLALCAAFFLLNFALPQKEPVSFPLYFAALSCGANPFISGGAYLIASVVSLSMGASLSATVQVSFLTLVVCIYKRMKRVPGTEKYAYALLAQLPFVFLYPHTGYAAVPLAPIWQKTILSALLFMLSFLFDGGLNALLFRAFRCRLPAHALAELCTVWVFLGIGLHQALGETVFLALSLFLILAAVLLLKSASAVPFALALSVPLCLVNGSVVPCALYAAYACFPLLLSSYGKAASAVALLFPFLLIQYAEGLFVQSAQTVVWRIVACALPLLLLVCLPEKVYLRARKSLLFYRERSLPRIAINRNRRAVGEQLYEVSSLFREIESAFTQEEKTDNAPGRLCNALVDTLCSKCANKRKCENAGVYQAMEKLIAVGCAKGRVNLIDLPAEITSRCTNSAGMLFAINKHLSEYKAYARELENARAGRQLLARQARGVSEILRDMALEQSEEYVFSESEARLSAALAEAGILSSEIFLYGEGSDLTVSVTVSAEVSGKRLCEAAEAVLGIPLSLAEKIPLAADRVCCVMRRKPNFDAAFGIASRPKEGEHASGDTHSILKIDERRFLMALSDGMGSGEGARNVSDHTLSLLESFYKAKMPSEIVLSTVNNLIAFSSEETFACLDLAAVNLDTGMADIVKIGSPAGFLLSGEELRVLEGESLPIGMLEAVHPATMRVAMKEDDFLLFMSDGVTSAFSSSTELYTFLGEQRPLNPQALAENVLAAALSRYGGRAEDDMTVLAVRLMKAA